jgi:hypothetical protein
LDSVVTRLNSIQRAFGMCFRVRNFWIGRYSKIFSEAQVFSTLEIYSEACFGCPIHISRKGGVALSRPIHEFCAFSWPVSASPCNETNRLNLRSKKKVTHEGLALDWKQHSGGRCGSNAPSAAAGWADVDSCTGTVEWHKLVQIWEQVDVPIPLSEPGEDTLELPNRPSVSFLSNDWIPETAKVVHPNLRDGIFQTLLRVLWKNAWKLTSETDRCQEWKSRATRMGTHSRIVQPPVAVFLVLTFPASRDDVLHIHFIIVFILLRYVLFQPSVVELENFSFFRSELCIPSQNRVIRNSRFLSI